MISRTTDTIEELAAFLKERDGELSPPATEEELNWARAKARELRWGDIESAAREAAHQVAA